MELFRSCHRAILHLYNKYLISIFLAEVQNGRLFMFYRQDIKCLLVNSGEIIFVFGNRMIDDFLGLAVHALSLRDGNSGISPSVIPTVKNADFYLDSKSFLQ